MNDVPFLSHCLGVPYRGLDRGSTRNGGTRSTTLCSTATRGRATGSRRPIELEATRARRGALRHRVGRCIIAIPCCGGTRSRKGYFFYIIGLESPDACLVIIASQGQTASHLFLPARNPSAERWTGASSGPGTTRSVSPASPRAPLDSLDCWLANTQRSVPGPLYTLLVHRDRIQPANSILGGC
jgi:Aminopeptidase P, N-terminal domain